PLLRDRKGLPRSRRLCGEEGFDARGGLPAVAKGSPAAAVFAGYLPEGEVRRVSTPEEGFQPRHGTHRNRVASPKLASDPGHALPRGQDQASPPRRRPRR